MKQVFVVAMSCIVVLVCGQHAGAQPSISFKSRELQEGRNYVKTQIAVPEVGEASGQVSYSYEIEVPSARGATPKVRLEYASGARYSEIGWGWELTIPAIERTQRFGVVDYSVDLFRFRNGHTIHEIVPTGVTTPGSGVEYKRACREDVQSLSAISQHLGDPDAQRIALRAGKRLRARR